MTRIRLLVVLLLAMVLAACSNAGHSSSATGHGSSDQVATPALATTLAPQPDPAGALAVGGTELGRVLTDLTGRTLYAFTKDKDGKSSCYDDCAVTWPALTVHGQAMVGSGVKEDWLATAERRDGTTQVTYKGMPLYYYADDAQPGQTNGQGLGGVWFAVAPDGGLIRAADGADSTAGPDDGYSYP